MKKRFNLITIEKLTQKGIKKVCKKQMKIITKKIKTVAKKGYSKCDFYVGDLPVEVQYLLENNLKKLGFQIPSQFRGYFIIKW